MDLPPPPIRCRQIAETDIEAVRDLLSEGFPARSPAGWRRALDRLGAHRGPDRLPRYGYLLESAGRAVGVLLTIASCREDAAIVCNLSSWYVQPAFRGFAPLLCSTAARLRDVCYVNVSPHPDTTTTIEALGFVRYTAGAYIGVPMLGRDRRPTETHDVEALAAALPGASEAERTILRDHAALGCIAFWCVADALARPFVFVRRPAVKGLVPCAQLVYCRDPGDVATCARSVGRRLLRHGLPLVAIDAAGPMAGLVGRYVPGQAPRYFKGPERPRLGDLAYSEAALFGL